MSKKNPEHYLNQTAVRARSARNCHKLYARKQIHSSRFEKNHFRIFKFLTFREAKNNGIVDKVRGNATNAAASAGAATRRPRTAARRLSAATVGKVRGEQPTAAAPLPPLERGGVAAARRLSAAHRCNFLRLFFFRGPRAALRWRAVGVLPVVK